MHYMSSSWRGALCKLLMDRMLTDWASKDICWLSFGFSKMEWLLPLCSLVCAEFASSLCRVAGGGGKQQ